MDNENYDYTISHTGCDDVRGAWEDAGGELTSDMKYFIGTLIEAAPEGSQLATEVPILSYIGPEAEMGGLMYDLPASPLFLLVRNIERKLFRIMKDRRRETRESPETPTETKNTLLLNFCLSHREGHITGLRKCLNETGISLLNTILINEQVTNINNQNKDYKPLVYKIAALFEAAESDPKLTNQLVQALGQNDLWRTKVIESEVTHGLKIPGITSDTQKLFPGTTNYELPPIKPDRSHVAVSLLKRWRDITTITTYNRAMEYIKEMTATNAMSQTATQIIATVNQL